MTTYPSGYIEYDIVKKDYNGTGVLINTTVLPILPNGITIISGEPLFFTPTAKTIPLRFVGHSSDLSGSNGSTVQIYRNNVLLVIGVDWDFLDRSNLVDPTDTTLQTGLNVTNIEILHDDNVISTGIYTAYYPPRYLLNPESNVFFDFAQTILYLPNGGIEFKIDQLVEVPETSNVFLKIAIRNNSYVLTSASDDFLTNLTPKVSYYKLFYSEVT